MKKTFLSLSKYGMIIFSCLLAMSVSSCGDDDEGNSPKPQPNPATTVTVQTAAYLATNTLKFFDMYMVDPNGDSTKITLDNTEVVTKYDFGRVADSYKLTIETYAKKYGFEMRIYKHNTKTLKSFPAKATYKIVGKPNGTAPEPTEKVSISIIPDVKLSNNTDIWTHRSISTAIHTSAPIDYNWDEYVASSYSRLESNINLTFDSAQEVSGSVM